MHIAHYNTCRWLCGVIIVLKSKCDNCDACIKGQKDKQRSTKHTYKTKDCVTRINHHLYAFD